METAPTAHFLVKQVWLRPSIRSYDKLIHKLLDHMNTDTARTWALSFDRRIWLWRAARIEWLSIVKNIEGHASRQHGNPH